MNPQLYGLSSAAWFSGCGLPLEASDRRDARDYLDALGLHTSIAIQAGAPLGTGGRNIRLAAGAEHEVTHGAAAVAAARVGMSDPALVRAAAGAASMAAHGRSLARLAGVPDTHVFVRKYALFEGGRWPLGIVSGALHLF